MPLPSSPKLNDAPPSVAQEVARGLQESASLGREVFLSWERCAFAPIAAADIVTYGFIDCSGVYKDGRRLSTEGILANVREFIRDRERLTCVRENLVETLSQLSTIGIVIEKRGSGGLYSLNSDLRKLDEHFTPWLRALSRTHDTYSTFLASLTYAAQSDELVLPKKHMTTPSTKLRSKAMPHEERAPKVSLTAQLQTISNRLTVELNSLGLDYLTYEKKFRTNKVDPPLRAEMKAATGRFISCLNTAKKLVDEATKNKERAPLWLKMQLRMYGGFVSDNWLNGNTPSDELTAKVLKRMSLLVETLPVPHTARLLRRDILRVVGFAVATPPLLVGLSFVEDEVASQRTFGTRAHPRLTVINTPRYPLRPFEKFVDEVTAAYTTDAFKELKAASDESVAKTAQQTSALKNKRVIEAESRRAVLNETKELMRAATPEAWQQYVTAYGDTRSLGLVPLTESTYFELVKQFPTPLDFAKELFRKNTGSSVPDRGMAALARHLYRSDTSKKNQLKSETYISEVSNCLLYMGRDIAQVEGPSIIRDLQINVTEESVIIDHVAGLVFARSAAGTIENEEIRAALDSRVMKLAFSFALNRESESWEVSVDITTTFDSVLRSRADLANAYSFITRPGSDPKEFGPLRRTLVDQIEVAADAFLSYEKAMRTQQELFDTTQSTLFTLEQSLKDGTRDSGNVPMNLKSSEELLRGKSFPRGN